MCSIYNAVSRPILLSVKDSHHFVVFFFLHDCRNFKPLRPFKSRVMSMLQLLTARNLESLTDAALVRERNGLVSISLLLISERG